MPRSALRRALNLAAVTGLAVTGVQLIGVGSAFAHDNSVTGSAVCQQNGTYTVTWTVKNNYADEAETATVTGHAPASSVAPGSLNLDKLASGTVTQTGVSGSAKSASLSVHGVWTPDGVTFDITGSVVLAGTCGTPTTPTATATAPKSANGACVAGKITKPSVTVPGKQGVTYTLDGRTSSAGTFPVSAGTHVVTAASKTLKLIGTTKWTLVTKSAPGSCSPTTTTTTPVRPDTTQSQCTGSGPSKPTLSVVPTKGITYTVTPSGPYRPGQTVTVKAVTKKGYTIGTVGPRWTKSSSTSASRPITFKSAPAACSGTAGQTNSNTPVDNTAGASPVSTSGGGTGPLAETGARTWMELGLGLGLVLLGAALTVGGRRRVTA